jgi:TolA-binding protein
MSDVVSQRPDPEDLSVYVRRGHASGVERRALGRALDRDAGLRVAHQVGLDLDQDSSVQAGDEQLIARAADFALAQALAAADPAPELAASPPARRARVLRFVTWQLVASMVAVFTLSFSGVSAALWVASVVPWAKTEEVSVAAAPRPARRVRSKPQRALAAEQVAPPTALPSEPEALAEALPEVADRPPHRAPSASSRRADARGNDAQALFHAANAARRAGDLSRAKHLYAALIAHEPRSDEAQLAHVSLGKLLLAQGQAGAAEREFQRYLESGGGPLSEEALFSRAQSLLRLGRTQAERAAWRALLAAFPESVYAAQAKQRLGVLDL